MGITNGLRYPDLADLFYNKAIAKGIKDEDLVSDFYIEGGYDLIYSDKKPDRYYTIEISKN